MVPVFKEYFSGEEFLLTRSLQAFGWHCMRPIDWALNPADDLADDNVQAAQLKCLGFDIDVAWFGIDCRNFSRVRDIPMKGMRPVRSDAHPAGLPDLPTKLAEDINSSNNLASFVVRACRLLLRRGARFVIENPENSYLWSMPDVRNLLDEQGVRDT